MATFQFKQFSVDDHGCGMKIGTDSVLLAAWLMKKIEPDSMHSVIDVGAGSGVLSLLLASGLPDAHITALEIEPDAVSAARANFEASPWPMRLEVVSGDFADYHPERPVDLIISNPPYFNHKCSLVSPTTERAAARHADSLSYESLLRVAKTWLSPDGILAFVSPADLADGIVFKATLVGMHEYIRCFVSMREPKPASRILWLFKPCRCSHWFETLAIRSADSTFTKPYLEIVKPYYLYL